ncbi:MAG: hypothetical protein QOE05_537 [Actinomycetota bacterium]|jgi:hypothetical protein|nr:hypothetical protein [Actinomycetota bacterium]
MTETTPSEEPQPGDLDQLLSASIEAASSMLSVDGEFYPFAVALTIGGELVSPAVDPGTDRPDAEDVVELLIEALREGRANIRAAALCSDVTLASDNGDQDAIRVELEAPEHQPVTILVPYEDGPLLGEPFGVDAEARIFVS